MSVAGGPGAAAAQDLGVPGVATCLRSPLPESATLWQAGSNRTSGVSLFELGDGPRRPAWLEPLGETSGCPRVAAAPGGGVLTASALRRGGRILVLRRGLGASGGLRTVLSGPGAGTTDRVDVLGVAASGRGDEAVLWRQVRLDAGRRFSAATRVWLAMRRPGARFLRPVALGGWQSLAPFGMTGALGFDAAGRLTAMWNGGRRGRGTTFFPRLYARVWPPSGPPGPTQSLRGSFADVLGEPVALDVLPDGRAYAAAVVPGGLVILGRSGPSRRFSVLLGVTGQADISSGPAIVARSDGAVAAAFLTAAQHLRFAMRPAAGARFRAGTVGNFREPAVTRLFTIESTSGPPLDLPNRGPHIAFSGPDGVAISWVAARGLPALGNPSAAWTVTGTLRGRFGARRALGSPCRAVNGTALPGGRTVPAVAFTDNVTVPISFHSAGPALEQPVGGGRLHLQTPEAAPPALRIHVRVTAPARQRLRYAQPLRVRAACDRACDLRAVVLGGRGTVRALGTASLPAAGRIAVRLQPADTDNLALPRRRPTRVAVYACAPNGAVAARQGLAVAAVALPAPQPPVVRGLRARRVPRGIRVTGRLSRPLRAEAMYLDAYQDAPDAQIEDRLVPLGRRTRFSVLLSSRGLEAARWVAATTVSFSPPYRTKISRVRIR